jgi:hypothetical protein
MSPSPRLQVLEEIPTHVFPKFRTLMEECSPSGCWDTSHNPKDVEMSNLSTCLYTLCYLSLDLSPYFKESWNLIYGTPLKKHKREIPIVVKKNTKLVGMKYRWHWKIKMQLTMDDTNLEWLD